MNQGQQPPPPLNSQSPSSSAVTPRTDDDDIPTISLDPEEQKKQERLKKNREIARSCRKRKKERMADMEEEVKRLRQENQLLTLDLQGQLYNAPEKEDKRIEHLNRIREMMNNKETTEEEIGKVMNEYIEEWSDYGNDRRNQIQFHIEKLKQLLLPLRVISLCESGSTVFNNNNNNNRCKIANNNNNKSTLKNNNNKNEIFSILSDITSNDDDASLSSSSTSSVASCNSVSTTISSTSSTTSNTNTDNTSNTTNAISSSSSSHSLWKLLCGAINISEEQRHAIQSLSINDVQTQRHKVGECVKLLNDLKDKVFYIC